MMSFFTKTMGRCALFAVAMSTFSAQLTASPNTDIGTDSINPGETAVINLVLAADGDVAGLDFKFEFDDTEFSVTPSCVSGLPTTGTGQATVTCAVLGNRVYVFIAPPYESPVPRIVPGSHPLGIMTFQSQPTTPIASYDLTTQDENYFDSASTAVTSTPSSHGRIDVVGCNTVVVRNRVDSGLELVMHEACEQLIVGPNYQAADSGVIFSGGITVEFLPGEQGVRFEQGSIIDIEVCGQSLCLPSEAPMKDSCHSCVTDICADNPECCQDNWSQQCVDLVGVTCRLTCE